MMFKTGFANGLIIALIALEIFLVREFVCIQGRSVCLKRSSTDHPFIPYMMTEFINVFLSFIIFT